MTEAHRWFKNGDHPDDYTQDHEGIENGEVRVFTGEERKALGWEGDVVRYFRHPEIRGDQRCGVCSYSMHDHGWIDNGGAGNTVCPGDWIVKIDGKYYPTRRKPSAHPSGA